MTNRISLLNAGTICHTGMAGVLMSFGTSLTNPAGALYDIEGDGGIFRNGGGTVVNAGLFRKSGGTGTFTVDVPFNNTGTVEADSGTLGLLGGITQISGDGIVGGVWIARNGATLFVNASPVRTLGGSVQVDGVGSVVASSYANDLVASLQTVTAGGSLTFSDRVQDVTALQILDGTLHVGPGAVVTAGFLHGGGNVSVATSGTLAVNAVQLAELSVMGRVNVSAGSASVSVLSGLSVAGFMDLGDNDLVLHGASEAAIRGLVKTWYNGGTQVTAGLGSSLAGMGSGPDLVTTLAVITNSDGRGGALFSTFDSIASSTTDVLVKYTYFGDTDLNGYVDGHDLANLLAGMNGGLTGWINGDINYDGFVNVADLNLLLAGLRGQGVPLGGNGDGGSSGAVPEPSTIVTVLGAAPWLMRRRR